MILYPNPALYNSCNLKPGNQQKTLLTFQMILFSALLSFRGKTELLLLLTVSLHLQSHLLLLAPLTDSKLHLPMSLKLHLPVSLLTLCYLKKQKLVLLG